MLLLLFVLAMAGNSPEAPGSEESGPGQPSNSDEHCPMLAAMVQSQVLDGTPTITDDQWVESLDNSRGPPPPMQQIATSSSSAPSSIVIRSSSQCQEVDNTTSLGNQSEISTPARPHRERSRTPPGAPISKIRQSMALSNTSSLHDQMYEALRSQRPSLSQDELQSALDVAFALRSTLEAEGHTHEEIVDGAQQVTNALKAQWVAEDMVPENVPEDRDMDESKEEEEHETDEEVSSSSSDALD